MNLQEDLLVNLKAAAEQAQLEQRLEAAMGAVGLNDSGLRNAFTRWGPNLIDPEFHAATDRAPIEGGNSLDRVWGAAAYLARSINAAEMTGEQVPDYQLTYVGNQLSSAAAMMHDGTSAKSLELIGSNVVVLAQVMGAFMCQPAE